MRLLTYIIVNTDTFSTDTSTFIKYGWVSENNFGIANITSQPGEADPGFTNARNFQRLFSFIVSVEDLSLEIPFNFELFQNYPNPFNPETAIKYDVPQNGRVEVVVFNILGQRIRTLVNEIKPPGFYHIKWDGTSDLGLQMTSGVYFYRLKAGEFTQTRKMLLLQ